MKKILFVCLGNICRSPAADGITKALVERRGLADRVLVDSAGTANYQVGKGADPRMFTAAGRRGYDLQTRAKQLTPAMIREHDLVIAMDRENLREIILISRGDPNHVRLLSDFLGPSWPRDVPDPYQGDEAGFEYVLDMLEEACPNILDSLFEPNTTPAPKNNP